jgi:hypothetical protein
VSGTTRTKLAQRDSPRTKRDQHSAEHDHADRERDHKTDEEVNEHDLTWLPALGPSQPRATRCRTLVNRGNYRE